MALSLFKNCLTLPDSTQPLWPARKASKNKQNTVDMHNVSDQGFELHGPFISCSVPGTFKFRNCEQGLEEASPDGSKHIWERRSSAPSVMAADETRTSGQEETLKQLQVSDNNGDLCIRAPVGMYPKGGIDPTLLAKPVEAGASRLKRSLDDPCFTYYLCSCVSLLQQ